MKQKLKNWLAVVREKGPQGFKGFVKEAAWVVLFWATTILCYSSFKVFFVLLEDGSYTLAASAIAIGLALFWANLCIFGFWTDGSVKRRLEKRYDEAVVLQRIKLDQSLAISLKTTLLKLSLQPQVVQAVLTGADGKVVVSHPDDAAIDMYATALKARLRAERESGAGGWETGDLTFMKDALRSNADSSDWLDVGNYAAFLWNRGAK